MKKVLFLTLLFIFCNSVVKGFDEKSAKKIFESRCSICHPLDWALERKKTKKGWKETVERMRKKTAGNIINDEDVEIISEYLFRIRGK